ncbi:MAG: HRDC domain-containing protein, partial [Clostridiales bacterium]|nr:HRDC domain-containing protein [Clostridiales bacterium]
ESVDKPSYQKEVKQEMPKIKPIKEKPVQTERRVAQVHTTKYSEKFIEKDGFQVVTDDDGNILTNMDLLYRLRSLRSRIMKEENRPAYTIISNKGLVSLATYRPTTREEFISLYGLGEMTYNAYGMRFIQEIKNFFS